MPQTHTMNLAAETWVEATDADATTITMQVQGAYHVRLMTTVGAVEPADPNLGVLVPPGHGFDRAKIAEMIPGNTGANRVYLRAEIGPSRAFISHD